MNRWRNATWMALVVVAGMWGGVAQAGDPIDRVLELVPADLPFVLVVRDLEKAEKSADAFAKQLGPDESFEIGLGDIKEKVEIAAWGDLSKPLAVAFPEISNDDAGIVWVSAPEFKSKAKASENMKEVDGVWQWTKTGGGGASGAGQAAAGGTWYMRVKGEYVVAATSMALLDAGCKVDKTLASEMKARAGVWTGRDMLLHMNMDKLRDPALAGLANYAQMAPMFAMMLASQGGAGADPMAVTGMVNSIFKAVESLVSQVAYVDVAFGVSEKAMDITLATGYRDGGIKSYLAAQKPATKPFFTRISDQPYMVAMGYDMPGDTSAFVDYLDGAIAAAIPPGPSGEPSEMARGIKDAMQMYRMMTGIDFVMAMSPGGMKETGDVYTNDASKMLVEYKKAMSPDNVMMKTFGGGAKVTALGTTKIGGADVERYEFEFDATNPMMGPAAGMLGKDSLYAVGIVDKHVRFCLGNETDIKRAFGSEVAAPLASSPYVKAALAKLPKKHNAVILLDIATAMGSFAPLMGGGAAAPVAPGAPIAISVSLSGEPARLDVHVPAEAIKRAKEVMPSSPPASPM